MSSVRDAVMKGDVHLLHKALEDLKASDTPVKEVVNKKDGLMSTRPLHIAAELGNTNLVEVLLQHGANVMGVDQDEATALHYAASAGHEEVVRRLHQARALLDARDEAGDTPLHWAASHGKVEVVQELLDSGANVDHSNKSLWTPLHVAARTGFPMVVIKLLEHGASVKAVSSAGNTPLHEACTAKHTVPVAHLLQAGANPNFQNDKGQTPLHYACLSSQLAVVELLLEAGADAHITSQDPNPPYPRYRPCDMSTNTAIHAALGTFPEPAGASPSSSRDGSEPRGRPSPRPFSPFRRPGARLETKDGPPRPAGGSRGSSRRPSLSDRDVQEDPEEPPESPWRPPPSPPPAGPSPRHSEPSSAASTPRFAFNKDKPPLGSIGGGGSGGGAGGGDKAGYPAPFIQRPPSGEAGGPMFRRPSSPSLSLTPLGEKAKGIQAVHYDPDSDNPNLDDIGKKAQMQAIKNQLIAKKKHTSGRSQFMNKYGLAEAHDLFAPREDWR